MSGFSAGQCEKLDILLLSSEIACPASSTAKVLVLEEGSRWLHGLRLWNLMGSCLSVVSLASAMPWGKAHLWGFSLNTGTPDVCITSNWNHTPFCSCTFQRYRAVSQSPSSSQEPSSQQSQAASQGEQAP